MDEDELTLIRIRILRRDEYRCQHRPHQRSPICGTPGQYIGYTPIGEQMVCLCYLHSY